LALATVVGVALASIAESASAANKSVVLWAEGPDRDLASAQATAGLGGDYSVADARKWQRALEKQGQRGAIAPVLKDEKKRRKLFDQMRRAARLVEADEVVLVLTHRTQRGSEATLMVIDPDNDEVPPETNVALGRGNDELTRAVAQTHGGTKPRSEEPPESASSEPSASPSRSLQTGAPERDEVPGAAAPASHRVGQDLFEVAAGIEGGMRRFNYSDGLTGNLRPYHLDGAPLVAARGEIYPLAGAHWLDVGVVLSYAHAFALESQATTGGTLGTSWSRSYAGGRVRVRTGSLESPIVGLGVGYGNETFSIEGPPSLLQWPGVDYHFVKASGDIRIPFGRIAVLADAGYDFVLSAGDVADRFRGPTFGGVEAELGGAVTIIPSLEGRLTASYRRFFYTMHPTPGDNYVAGGALDEFSTLQASVAYVY
jgi:hypothetical protein